MFDFSDIHYRLIFQNQPFQENGLIENIRMAYQGDIQGEVLQELLLLQSWYYFSWNTLSHNY